MTPHIRDRSPSREGVFAVAAPSPDGSGPSLRVQLLGGFRVSVAGRRLPDDAWSLRRAAALVKLLALAPGHRLPREQALDALWPDADPAAAANNLHRTLHVARRALDPAAARGSPYLRLAGDVLRLAPGGPVGRRRRLRGRGGGGPARPTTRPPTGRRSRSTPATCCRRTPTRTGRPTGARRCARRTWRCCWRWPSCTRRGGEPEPAIAALQRRWSPPSRRTRRRTGG